MWPPLSQLPPSSCRGRLGLPPQTEGPCVPCHSPGCHRPVNDAPSARQPRPAGSWAAPPDPCVRLRRRLPYAPTAAAVPSWPAQRPRLSHAFAQAGPSAWSALSPVELSFLLFKVHLRDSLPRGASCPRLLREEPMVPSVAPPGVTS